MGGGPSLNFLVGGDMGFLVLIWEIYLVVKVGLQTREGHM